MLRFKFPAHFIHATVLAVIVLPCSIIAAQQPEPGNVPETQAPPPTASAPASASPAPAAESSAPLTLTLPSWQHGAYWQQHGYQLLSDFGDLKHFHDADMNVGPPAPGEKRVVFMGDSITQGWNLAQSFPGKPYINRGISGQTTTQMLLRFRQDVIDLEPKAVVIFGGTNDVAENTGPISPEQTEGDIVSMAQLAKANGIVPVICSILPSSGFGWHPGIEPAPIIASINKWLKNYANQHHDVYVDFYDAMKNAQDGLSPVVSRDGVHPGPGGHALMDPLVQAGIDKAMKSRE